jgi:hypothetical protein
VLPLFPLEALPVEVLLAQPRVPPQHLASPLATGVRKTLDMRLIWVDCDKP